MKELANNTKKSAPVRTIINQAIDILIAVGLPMLDLTERRQERVAMAFLAVAGVSNDFATAQSATDSRFLKTREIIDYINSYFEEAISSGSYDDIRRKDLLLPVTAMLIVNSAAETGAATNDPTRGYALNPAFATLIKSYGTNKWEENVIAFNRNFTQLKEELQRKRDLQKIPVTLPDGHILNFSLGEHNILQKAIIEDFLPNFGFGANVLYVGDTSDKNLCKDEKALNELGFFTLEHDELPDVVAYSPSKSMLFLIEAVYSSGPMSEIRVHKLKRQLENCKADNIIFVTAFLTKKDFRKWLVDIAWESEVWLADEPEHMVHFNGHKFLKVH